MTIHAEVDVARDLVALDRMRNRRRLARVRAPALHVEVLHCRHARRLRFLLQRRGTSQAAAEVVGAESGGATDDCGEYQAAPSHTAPNGTIFTAHFLKSVCFEIGSVASRVNLLMSCDASNQGTKTTPRGGLLRPRVSTRVRISPRRETSFTSTPRRTPSASASSGCMNTTAFGNARWSSGTRPVIEPECQCSSTRPVTSQNLYSSSGSSAAGSYGKAKMFALPSGFP